MFGLGFWELAVILLVAFLVFGPKRLPELARSLGKTLRQLRNTSADLRSTLEGPLEEVRKPLEDIRDDLIGTVHHIQHEVMSETEQSEVVNHLLRGEVVNPTAEDSALDEKRQKEVEEIYAAAARENANTSDEFLPDETSSPHELSSPAEKIENDTPTPAKI